MEIAWREIEGCYPYDRHEARYSHDMCAQVGANSEYSDPGAVTASCKTIDVFLKKQDRFFLFTL